MRNSALVLALSTALISVAATASGVMIAQAKEPWIPLCCSDQGPSRLILAQAATMEARARYDRIHEAMKQDVPDVANMDALNDQIITKLRDEYLSLAGRMAIYSQKYGSEHPAVIALRTQMDELQRSIKDEMYRIEQSYKSDYEIALAWEQHLRKSLAKKPPKLDPWLARCYENYEVNWCYNHRLSRPPLLAPSAPNVTGT
jgi:hypothetical protein